MGVRASKKTAISKQAETNVAAQANANTSLSLVTVDVSVERRLRDLHHMTSLLRRLYSVQRNLPKLIDSASFPAKKLDDYYVQLQIVVEDKRVGKIPVDIDNIFSAVEDLDEAAKILILGVAGVGKSSLLCYICYEWSKEDSTFDGGNENLQKSRIPSFQQNFSFVFKIRLKMLLDPMFCQELEGIPEVDQLYLVILYSLSQETLEAAACEDTVNAIKSITIDDIKCLNKFATLLLVDGYDEIEHLTRIPHVATQVVESLLSFPNVILTSRPNAVPDYLSARFDRRVENVGIGSDGAREFITKHFHRSGEEFMDKIRSFQSSRPEASTLDLLKYYFNSTDSSSRDIYIQLQDISRFGGSMSSSVTDLLDHTKRYHENLSEKLLLMFERNPVLKNVLSIPINAAMVCLISSDSEVIVRFEGSFSLAELYYSVIYWLAKRYLVKFEGVNPTDITPSDVLDTAELHSLKQIAYKKFLAKEIYIPGVEINLAYKAIRQTSKMGRKNDSSSGGLRKVNKLGLLRAISTIAPYEITFWPFGRFQHPEQEVLDDKVYFFIDNDNDQLYYAMKVKREVHYSIVTDIDLTSTWLAIRTIIKQGGTQHPTASDLESLEAYFMSKGYCVFYKISKSLSPAELEAQDLLHRKHSFVHLSFQEYLTAENLKLFLLSDKEEDVRFASTFIAEHRNEPRYLLTLKFLAGLVTQHDVCNDRDPLVQRFWEAILCQVDDTMELNLETKVTLLLHLVEQSKVNGKADSRIPHHALLIEFLNTTVVLNLSAFEESLIASGYVFPHLKNALLAVLTQDYAWMKSLAETRAASGDVLAVLGKAYLTATMKSLEPAAQQSAQQEKVLLLQKCTKLVLTLVASERWRVCDFSSGTLGGNNTDLLQIFIQLASHPNWLVKRTGIMALTELCTIRGVEIPEEKAATIVNSLLWDVTNGSLAKTILDLFTVLTKTVGEGSSIDVLIKIGLLQQMDIYEKRLELSELEKVVAAMPQPSFSDDLDYESIFQQLSTSNWLQRYLCIIKLTRLVSAEPTLVTPKLIDLIVDRSLDHDGFIKDKACQVLETFLAVNPLAFEDRHIDKLMERVNKPDQHHILASKARDTIAKLVGVRPDLARVEEWTGSLPILMNSSDGHYFETKSMLMISAAALHTNPALATSAIVDHCISLLRSEASDSFSSIRGTVSKLLSAIAQRNDPHLFPFCTMRQHLESTSDAAVRAGAIAFWSQLSRDNPAFLEDSLVSLIATMVGDENKYVKQYAIQALETFIGLKPDCVVDITLVTYSIGAKSTFQLQFVWETSTFVLDSPKTLEWVASHRPSFLRDNIFPMIYDLLCPPTLGDRYSNEKSRCSEAAIIFCRHLKSFDISDDQAVTILASMMEKLHVEQYSLNRHSQTVIAGLVKQKPHIVTEKVLHVLVGMRYEKKEEDLYLMQENARAIASIARKCPQLCSSTFAMALVARLSRSCLSADKALATVFQELMLSRRDLFLNDGLMESIVDATKASVSYTKSNQAHTLQVLCPLLAEIQNPALCQLVFEVFSSGLDQEDRYVSTKAWKHVVAVDSSVVSASTLFTLLFRAIGLRKREAKKVQRASLKPMETTKVDIKVIIEKLKDREWNVREDAIKSIETAVQVSPGLINSLVVDSLLSRLGDVGFGINDKAGSLLGYISSVAPSAIHKETLLSMINSDQYGVAPSAIKTWGYIARANGQFIDDKVVEAVFATLNIEGTNNEVVSATAWTLEAIASARGELITDDIVTKLGFLVYHKSRLVRQHVIAALGQMLSLEHVYLDSYRVRTITLMVRDPEWQVRVAAVNFLCTLATLTGDVSNDSILALVDKLGDPEKEVRQVVITTLGVMARCRPDPCIIDDLIAKFDFENFNRILEENRAEIVRQTAAAAVGEVINNCPSLAHIDAVHRLLLLLHSGDVAIQTAAMESLGTILGCRHDLIHADVVTTICDRFADKNSSLFEVARKTLMAAAESMSDVILDTLSHPSWEVREVLVKSLTRAITNSRQWNQLRVDSLLKIIAYYDAKDPEREELIDAAKRALDGKVSTLTEDDKADLVAQFELVMSLSYESKPFLGKVCKRILSSSSSCGDGCLATVDRDLLLLAIQHGLGMVLTRHTISFGDATYTCQAADYPFLAACLERALSLNHENVLVSQYTDWRPIFPNSGRCLRVAASEIQCLPSLVAADSVALDVASVYVHFMILSNHHRQHPPTAMFLLCEKRDYFGHYMIRKYTLEDHQGTIIPIASTGVMWMEHPRDVDRRRKDIFTSMEYLIHKPRYFSKMYRLEAHEATSFLLSLSDAAIFTHLSRMFYLGKAFHLHSFCRVATELKKYELLRLADVDGEDAVVHTRKESIDIDTMDRLNGVIRDVEVIKESLSSPASLSHAIEDEAKSVGEEIQALKLALAQLTNDQEYQRDEMLHRLAEHDQQLTTLNQISSDFEDIVGRCNQYEATVAALQSQVNQLDQNKIQHDWLVYQEQCQKIEELIRSHEARLQDNSSNSNNNNDNIHEEIQQLQRDLVNLKADAAERQYTLEQLTDRFAPVMTLLSSRLAEEQWQQHSLPDDHPHRHFYKSFIQQMSAVYFASAVVQTDIVSSQRRGLTGNVGNLLSLAGAYVPVFGAAVQLCGTLLTALDQVHQERMIQRWYAFAGPPSDIEQITKAVARMLLEAEGDLDFARILTPATFRQTLERLLGITVADLEVFIQSLWTPSSSSSSSSSSLSKKCPPLNDVAAHILVTVAIGLVYQGELTAVQDCFDDERKASVLFHRLLDEYAIISTEDQDQAMRLAREILETGKDTLSMKEGTKYEHRRQVFLDSLAGILSAPSFRWLLSHHDGAVRDTFKKRLVAAFWDDEVVFKRSSEKRTAMSTAIQGPAGALFGIREQLDGVGRNKFVQQIRTMVYRVAHEMK